MATVESPVSNPNPNDSAIHATLNRLRWMIRGYVLVEGIAWCIIFTAVAFWMSLAVDWLFEPPRSVRVVLLFVYAVVVGYVFLRRVLGRAFTRLSDANMAVLLERRYDDFNDRLVTSIELEGRRGSDDGYNDNMLVHTRREAAEMVERAGLASVFDMAPLFRSCLMAVLAVVSIALFGSFQERATGIWTNRNLLLGDQLWPRISKITVDGFPENESGVRVHKVAKGGGVIVNVMAGISKDLSVPDSIEIEYESEGGINGEANMTKIAEVVPDRGQPFRYSFENVQTSTYFNVNAKHDNVFGKADRVRDLWIEVVKSPAIRDLQLESDYPTYLEKSADKLRVTGVMSLPEGTKIVVVATSTKPLLAAECVVNTPTATKEISIIPDAEDPQAFRCDIGTLTADTELLFTLTDTDRVSNRQPIRMQINMVPDDSPVVEARFVGIGNAITPKAMLPLAGEVTDDHGIARTWYEYRVADEEPIKLYFEPPANGQLEQDPPLIFDVVDLELEPGEKFRISVKATDNYALADEPHLESSKVEFLDVVTESQLLAILEDHEAVLRRRFEEIFERMTESHDSLARVELEAIFMPESTEDESGPTATDSAEASGAEEEAPAAAESDSATTPPSEDDAQPQKTPAARLRSIALLTVSESLQNSERSGHETREIAKSFEDILVELRNNRVSYFDEKELRLQNQIADPMVEIADLLYPRLDEKLVELRTAIEQGDQIAAEVALSSSRNEIDAILREMTEILGRMKELQNFNKLLADFREIIANHDRISQLTKQRQKELKESFKKNLLED